MKKIKSLLFIALCLSVTACQKSNDKSSIVSSEPSAQDIQQEAALVSSENEETNTTNNENSSDTLASADVLAKESQSYSQEIIQLFEESEDSWVGENYGSVVKQWVSQIAKENNTELLLKFCAECKSRTFFDRSFYTVPNPLICVIEADWKDGFDVLLEQYYDLVNLKYETGKYSENIDFPLQTAVKSENIYYVTRLLEMSADVNVDFPEGLYSPIKDNLLSSCNNPQIEELLMAKGIETSFKTDMKMTKCISSEDSIVKLYEAPDENSSFTEYEYTDDDAFGIKEVSYRKAEKVADKTLSGYVQLKRWTKVEVNGNSGWVKPGQMFLAFGYFEP